MAKKSDNDKQQKIQNDLTFKWLTELSSKPIICLINGLFNENYPIDGKIKPKITHSKQDVINPDYTLLIVDKLLVFKYDDVKQSYHIELQTRNDTDMLNRMLNYGFGIAVKDKDNINIDKNIDRIVCFPKQTVVFIEPNRNIKDNLVCELRLFNVDTDTYDSVVYKIPVFKIYDKSLTELQSQHLSILIPFKLSELNKALNNATTDEDRRSVLEGLSDLVQDVLSVVSEEYHNGYLSSGDFIAICNSIKIITDFFYTKFQPYSYVEDNVTMMIQSNLTEEDKKKIRQESIETEKLDIAKKMKEENISIDTIIRVTGLTKEEVEDLK